MMTIERTITELRTGDSDIQYAVAIVSCPVQATLYAIDVVTTTNYSDDPGIKIYAFDNPKAACKFILENSIDSNFTWPKQEKRIEMAPDYYPDFPESSIICAGTARFPDNWTYPAPLGIAACGDVAEHGKGVQTYTAKGSYSGALCQGYITVLVTLPSNTVSVDSGDELTVYKCNDCGYVGIDFDSNGKCPVCGNSYKCATCDYEGITPTCPHCGTISSAKTPNTTSCYTIGGKIAINTQFEEHS